MSEDSDPDEFFDAEERTPVRTARTSALTSVSDEDDSVTVPITDLSHNIAEEEQKLLEAQRVAEERRRKEDEEIQQKLVELMKLKEKQKEAKEAEMRAKEAERRRRKLQDMRMNMSEDASSHQHQRASDSNTDVEEQQPRTDSPEDNNSVGAVGTASLALASGDSCLGPSTSSDTSTSSNEEPHQTVSEPLPIIHVTEPDDQSVNFNSPDTEKFASKKMTMVLTKNLHSAPSVENDPACGATGGGVAATIKEEPGEEPDLIQSVKTSSLGRDTPAAPVAPPRRRGKHRGGAGTTRSSAGASIDMDSDADSIGELETPTSTVFNLTQELERSLCLSVPAPAASAVEEQSVHDLDMTLATRGKRLVTASEDASAKAEDLRSMTGSTTDNQSAGSSENDGAAAAMAARRLVRSTHAKCEQIDAEKARSMSAEEVFTVNVGTQGGEIPLSMLRPRTNSGSRYLSDCEILEQVTVLNLDTGEQVPLAHAEEKLPKCINPLSLHIMRRTKEYSSDSSLHKGLDEETPKTISTIGSPSPGNSSTEPASLSGSRAHIKKRGAKFKKLIGKTAKKIKLKADNVLHRDDDKNNSSDEEELGEGRSLIKIKAAHKHKGPYDFDLLVPVQDIIGAHVGAVWCMKFSPCGRLLASGGQDNLLRVWVLKDAFSYFDDMRTKYNEGTKVSPAPSQDSLNLNEAAATSHSHDPTNAPQTEHPAASDPAAAAADDDWFAPFRKRPLQVYSGHAADLLDISWSKNYFLLSASMDKTVRLWHVSRGECLCCFQHIDFVTSIAFHPKDDRYFLSGSLDGKLRLWSIPDKKVTLWNEVSGHTKLITAANFCLNGKFAVVGTYDGRCVFYSTEQLKYYTQIHVRSTRGKNSRGRKITGVEPFPGEDKLLVTSNDSRIRMYDLRDLSLTCKFKGCANNSSQIKAGFSHDGRYIVCGSEDHFVYIWRTQHEFYKFSSARRDRSDYWEGIKAHNAVVTTAIFSPHPRLIIKPQFEYVDADNKTLSPDDQGEVLISADYSGTIKVFINKFKPESMM